MLGIELADELRERLDAETSWKDRVQAVVHLCTAVEAMRDEYVQRARAAGIRTSHMADWARVHRNTVSGWADRYLRDHPAADHRDASGEFLVADFPEPGQPDERDMSDAAVWRPGMSLDEIEAESQR